MARTLRDDLRELLLVKDGEQRPLFSSAELDTLISSNRVVGRAAAEDFVGRSAYSSWDSPIEVSDAGLVRFRLVDMLAETDDDRTYYGFNPQYAINASVAGDPADTAAPGFRVLIDNGGVLATIPFANYEYDEISMVLKFDAQRTETSPIVYIEGFVVDMRSVKYDALTRYATKLLIPGNVRGQEFNQHYDRVINGRDELYGGQEMRRGSA